MKRRSDHDQASRQVPGFAPRPSVLAELLVAACRREPSIPDLIRGAAEEMPQRRVRRDLRRLADRLDDPSADLPSLAEPLGALPLDVQVAANIGLDSDRLAENLSEIAELRRLRRSSWTQLAQTLGYPVILLLLSLGLLALVAYLLIPSIHHAFVDFGAEIPPFTEVVLASVQTVPLYAIKLMAAVALALMVIRLVISPSMWQYLMWTNPICGLCLLWTATAAFTRQLAALLRSGMTLPEAFEIVSQTTPDPLIAHASRSLSAATKGGMPLSRGVAAAGIFPRSLVPLLHWGESTGQIAEALELATEILDARIERYQSWLAAFLPPVIYLVVGAATVSLAVALVLPLMSFVQALSLW